MQPLWDAAEVALPILTTLRNFTQYGEEVYSLGSCRTRWRAVAMTARGSGERPTPGRGHAPSRTAVPEALTMSMLPWPPTVS